MSQLQSALDTLAAVDFGQLGARQRLAAIAELCTGINRLESIRAQAVRAADTGQAHRDDGAVSMTGWLRGACRLGAAEAAAIVTTARRLGQLPATAAAFAAGELTAAHARVITRAITPARAAKAAQAGIDLADTDAILADLARRTGPQQTAQAAARWVAGVDPDGALDDAADTRRRFTLAPGLDGRVLCRGDLDAVGGETLHTALTAIMNGDRPAGDMRSHTERQADALVALARRALDDGDLPDLHGERPHLRVTNDWQTLSAARGQPGAARGQPGAAGGDLAWAGPITPETARQLARDTAVVRLITGPDGLPLNAAVVRLITGPDGLPLDAGREQRTATAAIRRAVEQRDGHRVFAYCDPPADWCDLHHLIHWAHRGPTSCDNGALLCERHHTACHEGGFTIHRDPTTHRWHTYRPDGTDITPHSPGRAPPTPPRR